MDLQTLIYLFVGISFAIYVGIALWAKASSTKDFYVAGGGVNPVANGKATAADWMSAASFISSNPKSLPPVTFLSTPPAPSREVSSKGLCIACLAASCALFSPDALPVPICAIPASNIIVFTSAKSRLT